MSHHLSLLPLSLCFSLRRYPGFHAGCVPDPAEWVWWSVPEVGFWCFQAECDSWHCEDELESRFLWQRSLGEHPQVSSALTAEGRGGGVVPGSLESWGVYLTCDMEEKFCSCHRFYLHGHIIFYIILTTVSNIHWSEVLNSHLFRACHQTYSLNSNISCHLHKLNCLILLIHRRILSDQAEFNI